MQGSEAMKVFSKYISKRLLSFIGLILALIILNIVAFAFTFHNAVSKNFGSTSPQNMLKQVAAASSSNGITNGLLIYQKKFQLNIPFRILQYFPKDI